jgi:serine/threonine-protein kinase HipA
VSTLAAVRLWGTRIGAVSMPDDGRIAAFQYDEDFLPSGIQVSPLVMSLRSEPYTFPALDRETFHGLPGLLSDSLPDRYGQALIDAWLAGQGRRPESFDSVERLCYIGIRGMGALEFAPSSGPAPSRSHDLQVAELVELASEVLSRRQELVASLAEGHQRQAMLDILSVGTSAAGARAKAVIAWNPTSDVVRSGQLDDLPSGFEHWLLKFDGVANNRDKETLADPQGYGAVEYAYSLMAKDAGILMSDCRLLEENGRRHFMTRRFDRGENGSKRHMQSLGALAHFDFNRPGAHSYEQAFLVMRRLGLSTAAVEQMFRRMAFNVVARNQDDHVKNIAFLMDRSGSWELAPAFDLAYSYRPGSPWTDRHQMSVNGKRDDFTLADFRACGQTAALPRGRANRIVQEVCDVASQWGTYAARVSVDEEHVRRISGALRLTFPAE